jgi:hypothetical protein
MNPTNKLNSSPTPAPALTWSLHVLKKVKIGYELVHFVPILIRELQVHASTIIELYN